MILSKIDLNSDFCNFDSDCLHGHTLWPKKKQLFLGGPTFNLGSSKCVSTLTIGTRAHVEKSEHLGVQLGLFHSPIKHKSSWTCAWSIYLKTQKFYLKNNILNIYTQFFSYIYKKWDLVIVHILKYDVWLFFSMWNITTIWDISFWKLCLCTMLYQRKY